MSWKSIVVAWSDGREREMEEMMEMGMEKEKVVAESSLNSIFFSQRLVNPSIHHRPKHPIKSQLLHITTQLLL